MKILLGSDPEMFVFKDDEPVSAWGMLEGTKHAPMVVEHGALQVDGMALEYNTDPATTLDEWERNHVAVQEQLLQSIAEGLELRATPTAFFSEEVFNTSPEEALILGCEPDFDAYTQLANNKPDGNVPFRTGAGHIHIGWGEGFDIKSEFHLGECRALVKHLDFMLGVPSIILDNDIQRRQLYGKAGCFRPKSYGLEYRTLSNFWVQDEYLRAWVFEQTHKAIRHAEDNKYVADATRRIINNNQIDRAMDYRDHYGVLPNGL